VAFHTDYFMHRTGVVMAVGAIADPELTGLDPDAIGGGGVAVRVDRVGIERRGLSVHSGVRGAREVTVVRLCM
jgi:hypothetical protein